MVHRKGKGRGQNYQRQLSPEALPGEELHVDKRGQRHGEEESLDDAHGHHHHLLLCRRHVEPDSHGFHHERHEEGKIGIAHHAPGHTVASQTSLVLRHMDEQEAKAESKYQPGQDVAGQDVGQMRKHVRMRFFSPTKVRKKSEKMKK